ncbi:MAG: tRNA preQ1(34) S-adenosylmethionine ribosyltransferase-isomerase QueA [Deltaproteobacteria bacterium]|nr:tRNA preQ1(34) S-adenosylmethionine ribosyltransferase-isomerase QueA [Deltaproteobacteria bacterium]
MDPAALDYPFDPAQIAQRPLPERDGGRLMVVERGRGVAAHAAVCNLAQWLRPGDLLVVNDAEVMPARLHGRRASGGSVEALLTEPGESEGTWRCLARRAGRMHDGERLRFAPDLEGVWRGATDDGPLREILFVADGDLGAVLRRRGELPLPPYIRRPDGPLPEDHARYQTVFARVPGAVAAPTAGLHFTPRLLAALAARGVEVVAVTLLVGPATFLPLRDGSAHHAVPAERYDVPASTAAAIARARAASRRIVAVGTTTVRALESASDDDGATRPGPGRSALVIGVGYRFHAVDALVTNLHLPRSSLLALVAAFAGTEAILAAYRAASRDGYRFYSYGDAMLIQ